MNTQQINWSMVGVMITLALQTIGFVWFMSALNSRVMFIADAQVKSTIEQKELAKAAQIHDIQLALLKQRIAILSHSSIE